MNQNGVGHSGLIGVGSNVGSVQFPLAGGITTDLMPAIE